MSEMYPKLKKTVNRLSKAWRRDEVIEFANVGYCDQQVEDFARNEFASGRARSLEEARNIASIVLNPGLSRPVKYGLLVIIQERKEAADFKTPLTQDEAERALAIAVAYSDQQYLATAEPEGSA